MSPFLFILCRKDLDPVYAAVQGGHAVAEILLNGNTQEWNNDYLIYLEVRDEQELEKWQYKLSSRDVSHSSFYEPDLDGQLTAIAVENNNKLFKSLRTL